MDIQNLFDITKIKLKEASKAEETKKAEKKEESLFSIKEKEDIFSKEDDSKLANLRIQAWNEQNSERLYVIGACDVISGKLTNFRDIYPNIIGFTAKVQSKLTALKESTSNAMYNLFTELSNCKTFSEYNAKMLEYKNKLDELSDKFNAEFDVITALAFALPEMSEVYDNLVNTELNMHDSFETILNSISTDSDKKNEKNTQLGTNTDDNTVFGNLDKQSVDSKLFELKQKQNEYKAELKEYKKANDEHNISKYKALVSGNKAMIEVYTALKKGFDKM